MLNISIHITLFPSICNCLLLVIKVLDPCRIIFINILHFFLWINNGKIFGTMISSIYRLCPMMGRNMMACKSVCSFFVKNNSFFRKMFSQRAHRLELDHSQHFYLKHVLGYLKENELQVQL